MRRIASVLAGLVLALGLSACFVNHAELIGSAEPAPAGAWSGGWVAEPLQVGDEPGFFHVSDVDPAAGMFAFADADPDGNPISDPIELSLRRVGDTLFLEARDRKDGPWLLFVVAEATQDRVVLAWKPRAETMRAAIDGGDLSGALKLGTGGAVEEVALTDFTPKRQQNLARDWQKLFTDERIVLRRMSAD